MIIVDTSVWVEHFRGKERALAALIEEGQVLTRDRRLHEQAERLGVAYPA